MILAAGGTRLAHDHLGSPIASLAQNALNPETGTFDGWGRYFSGAAPNADGGSAPTTHVGYTGHAYDADSDLTYAEARWYDPDIGAFLSRDPVAGSLSEPGTLEPFGYVRGNPLFYVDPDGRYGSKAEQEAAVYLSYHDSASWSHESNREVGGAIYDEFLNACGGKRLCASRVAYLNKRDNFRSLEDAQVLGTLFARQEDHLAGDKNALAGLSSEGAAFVTRGASDLRGGLAMVEAWGNDPLDPAARRRFFDEDNRDGAIYLAEQRQMHNSIAAGLTAAMAMPIGAALAETYVGGAALTGLSGKQVYDDVQSGDVGPGTVLAAVGFVGGVAATASEVGGALKAVANATKGKAPAATESASLATRLGCFAAGTEVLTSSGPVPIERVERGTGVACADPATGEWMTCEVTERLEHFYEGDVVRIVVKGKALVATGNHPFWVSEGVALDERPAAVDAGTDAELMTEGGRWVEARALDAGDTLVLVGGATARIDSIDHGMASLEVYNLRVADHHNYAVGHGGILVHNKAARNRSLPPPPRQVNASEGGTLFRGTTEGFPGSPALQRIGITPTSSDPIVGTLFGIEASNSGRGVLLLAHRSSVPTVPGNVLATLEAEVGVGLAPAVFAQGARSIPISTAREALGKMGINLPTRIADKAALDQALRNSPRLSPQQIDEFLRHVGQ
jgi:RHS repeat-associated protein